MVDKETEVHKAGTAVVGTASTVVAGMEAVRKEGDHKGMDHRESHTGPHTEVHTGPHMEVRTGPHMEVHTVEEYMVVFCTVISRHTDNISQLAGLLVIHQGNLVASDPFSQVLHLLISVFSLLMPVCHPLVLFYRDTSTLLLLLSQFLFADHLSVNLYPLSTSLLFLLILIDLVVLLSFPFSINNLIVYFKILVLT